MILKRKYKQPLTNLYDNHSSTLLWNNQNTEFFTYVTRNIESMGFFFLHE